MQNKSSDVVAIETFKRGMKKVFSDLEKKCSSEEQFVTLLEIMCLMAFERKSEIETNLEADTRVVQ